MISSESVRQEQDNEARCRISADEIFLLTCWATYYGKSEPEVPPQVQSLEYADLKSVLDQQNCVSNCADGTDRNFDEV